MRAAGSLAVCAIAAALAGCGDLRASSGADVFAQECSLCHSVIGNESLHRPGGDLLVYRLGRVDLLQFTRQMPVRDRLSTAQVNAVVDYIVALERNPPR